jgi:hypothetical protein
MGLIAMSERARFAWPEKAVPPVSTTQRRIDRIIALPLKP